MASSGSPASQSRVLIGLILGAVAGVIVNYVTTPAATAEMPQPPPAAWVLTVVKYVTKPINAAQAVVMMK